MDNNPNQNTPDEIKIEELLSQIKPLPTSRFYSKMRTAPWQRPISTERSRISILKPGRRLIWGLTVSGLVLAIFVITFIPSIRAAASQIIHLFLSAPSNQLEVQVVLTSPGDLYDFSNPANFPLSLEESQQQAGFGVKEISMLPEGLSFIGSRFDTSYNTVTLLYQANDYSLFLTQRLLGRSQDVFSIGDSAHVKIVNIGDIQGEFVVGGWKAISTQPSTENQTPTSSVYINANWDNDLPQSTLRWQVGDIVYELRSNGEGSPSQSELILLANELK